MSLLGLRKLFNLSVVEKLLRRHLSCLKSNASFVVTRLTTANVDVPTAARLSVANVASAVELPQADKRGYYSSIRFKM